MTDPKLIKVRAWLKVARADLELARDTLTKPAHYEAAIYHCQQAAEKALKGFLVFKEREFEWTHDLVRLLKECALFDSGFSRFEKDAGFLTPMATAFRYPGDLRETITEEEFSTAFRSAEMIFGFAVEKISYEESNDSKSDP